MMLDENVVSDEDLAALNDIRFELMAIARRRLNAKDGTAGERMNETLDAIDKELVPHSHRHSDAKDMQIAATKVDREGRKAFKHSIKARKEAIKRGEKY